MKPFISTCDLIEIVSLILNTLMFLHFFLGQTTTLFFSTAALISAALINLLSSSRKCTLVLRVSYIHVLSMSLERIRGHEKIKSRFHKHKSSFDNNNLIILVPNNKYLSQYIITHVVFNKNIRNVDFCKFLKHIILVSL